MTTHISLEDLVYGSTDADNLPTMAAKINQNNADVTNAINIHAAAVTDEHGISSGVFVGTTQSQTLTNKTMSGLSNTFSDIQASSIQDKFLRNDADDVSSGKITAMGGFDASNNLIINVSDPISDNDAANKSWTLDQDSTNKVNIMSWATSSFHRDNQKFYLDIPLASFVLSSSSPPLLTKLGDAVTTVLEFDTSVNQYAYFQFRLYPYQGGSLYCSVTAFPDSTSNLALAHHVIVNGASARQAVDYPQINIGGGLDGYYSSGVIAYNRYNTRIRVADPANKLLDVSDYPQEYDIVSMVLSITRPATNAHTGKCMVMNVVVYES